MLDARRSMVGRLVHVGFRIGVFRHHDVDLGSRRPAQFHTRPTGDDLRKLIDINAGTELEHLDRLDRAHFADGRHQLCLKHAFGRG